MEKPPLLLPGEPQISPVAITPCPDFWFSDGNIVLVVESVGFKVHRGQLSRHSDIFEGLFSLPPAGDNLVIDGCLCVELPGDSPVDMRFFLQALYDGLYLKPPYGMEFPRISGILRLSTKYFVDSLRTICLERLRYDWPETLREWDLRETLATSIHTGRYTPRETCAHPILVIELAFELGLMELLPASFYDLSRYGPSKIFAGTSFSVDPVLGTIASTPRSKRSAALAPSTTVRKLELPFLTWALRGRERAQIYMSQFVQQHVQNRRASDQCQNRLRKECVDSFYFIALNLLRSIGGIAMGRDTDPLFSLLQAVEMLTRADFSDGEKKCSLDVCPPCKEEFRESCLNARDEVWSQLPVWFGLEEESKTETLMLPSLQKGDMARRSFFPF